MVARFGGLCLACALSFSPVLASTSLRILQRELLCVSVTLQTNSPIASGTIGLAFDSENFALRNLEAGSALSAAPFRSCPHPSECPGPSLSCPELSDVDSGLHLEWELGEGESLEPGVHEIARVCFVPVGDVEPGVCSPIRFVDCLSSTNGLVRTNLVDTTGTTIDAQVLDGELCVTAPGVGFLRADANDDGSHDLSDAVFILGVLFLGGDTFSCMDAADADDSGEVDISDASYVLNHLFLGRTPPPPPFARCSTDPTDDKLGCLQHVCRPEPELELIAPAKVSFECGDSRTVQVCWNDLGAAAPEATDWVALLPCGANSNQFISYEYNSEVTASGCLDFTVRDGLEDGCYEFRYLPDNGYLDVARSDAMLLSSTTSPLEVDLTIATDAIQGGTCAGLGATAQVCWEVDQSTACATATDWIGLYAVGAENNQFVRDAWFYTSGEPSGCREVAIPASVKPAQYKFRYLTQNDYRSAGASTPFTYSVGSNAAEPVVELTTPVETVAPGEEICVNFRVTENSACTDAGDWVSLYACDAPNNSFGSWSYTHGALEGQFCWSAPEVPGCYEFRYLMKNGYTDTGARVEIRVESQE